MLSQVIASNLPADQILGLKEVFKSMDTDKDGVISALELKEGLAARGGDIPEQDLKKIMELAGERGGVRV